jgi:hypothetical protein
MNIVEYVLQMKDTATAQMGCELLSKLTTFVVGNNKNTNDKRKNYSNNNSTINEMIK